MWSVLVTIKVIIDSDYKKLKEKEIVCGVSPRENIFNLFIFLLIMI